MREEDAEDGVLKIPKYAWKQHSITNVCPCSWGEVGKSGHSKLPPSHHKRGGGKVALLLLRRLAWMLQLCLFLFNRILFFLCQRQGLKALHDGKHVFALILRHRLSYLIMSLCKKATCTECRYFPKSEASSCCLLSHQFEENGNECEWIGLVWFECNRCLVQSPAKYLASSFFFHFLWALFQVDA